MTSRGWWDEWDDTALQTQDSKFKPWRSEAEHATSRSRRLPTILSFTSGWGRNIFVSFKPPRTGNNSRTLARKAAVLNHYPRASAFPTSCHVYNAAVARHQREQHRLFHVRPHLDVFWPWLSRQVLSDQGLRLTVGMLEIIVGGCVVSCSS